jgi:hypothetical protein
MLTKEQIAEMQRRLERFPDDAKYDLDAKGIATVLELYAENERLAIKIDAFENIEQEDIALRKENEKLKRINWQMADEILGLNVPEPPEESV